MITSQGFGMGALVNFEWKMEQRVGYDCASKQRILLDGQAS